MRTLAKAMLVAIFRKNYVKLFLTLFAFSLNSYNTACFTFFDRQIKKPNPHQLWQSGCL